MKKDPKLDLNVDTDSSRNQSLKTNEELVTPQKSFLKDIGMRTLAVAIWDGIKALFKQVLGSEL